MAETETCEGEPSWRDHEKFQPQDPDRTTTHAPGVRGDLFSLLQHPVSGTIAIHDAGL